MSPLMNSIVIGAVIFCFFLGLYFVFRLFVPDILNLFSLWNEDRNR